MRLNKPTSLLISILLLSAFCFAGPGTQALAADEEGKTVRLATFGNSLTGTIRFGSMEEFVKQRGQTLHTEGVGAAGAPMPWLWEAMGDKCRALLDKGNWDGITLQPFLRNLEDDKKGAKNFIEYALKQNPDIKVYVYAQYTHMKGIDYQTLWRQDVSQYLETMQSAEHNETAMRTRGYYEQLTREIQKMFPDVEVVMVPVGHAFSMLDERIKAGQVPGIDNVFELWADATHVNRFGSYLVGMTWYSTIFGESPVGMDVSAYQGTEGNPRHPFITPEQSRLFQEIAWEVTATHPLSGVTDTESPLRVATPLLYPDAVKGELYKKELHASFGKRPYTWSLSEGSLPDGLSIEPTGLVVGTPTNTINKDFTVKVTDAEANSATSEFSINVEEDTAPEIAMDSTDLGTYAAGEQIQIQLKADGGNGQLRWKYDVSRAKTQEMHGLRLTGDGVLVGAAGEEGTHKLPIIVEDEDPTSPESDKATFTISVGPAGDDVLYVQPLPGFQDSWKLMREARKDDVDDNWQPRYIAQFEKVPGVELTKVVRGDSYNNKARFHVLYNGNLMYVGVFVEDDAIVVNKDNPTEGDCVEIYQDIFNNRQKVYNSDDRRVIVTADGNVSGLRGGVHGVFFYRTENGYFVGTREPSHSMKRGPKPGTVMGLDIAVHDKDSADGEVSTVMWRGDEIHEEDTSQFGTIIFAE